MSEGDKELSLDEALGLTKYLVPNTPEQDFYDHMTKGASPRIDNMLYELKHNLEHYKHLKEHGVRLTKARFTETFDLTASDYTRLMVIYYLQMIHFTRFVSSYHDEEGTTIPKLDLDKTVALFMEYSGIKKIIREGENSN